MKRLFLLLVVANIALFIWGYRHGRSSQPTNIEIPETIEEPIMLASERPDPLRDSAARRRNEVLFTEAFPILSESLASARNPLPASLRP